MKKPNEERQENIKTEALENLQKIDLPKDEIESKNDKFRRIVRFDHETQTQSIIVKLKIHSFKEKIYHQQKKLVKGFKVSPSLRKRCSNILHQVQHIIKKSSSDDSPNEEVIYLICICRCP